MDNELLLKNVGNTIRGLRLSNGLTQEKLSEKIHCDKNTIGNIERNRSQTYNIKPDCRRTECLMPEDFKGIRNAAVRSFSGFDQL